jgi:hypothetical protein
LFGFGKKDSNKPPEIPAYQPSPITELGWMISDATEAAKDKVRSARTGLSGAWSGLFGKKPQAPDPSYDTAAQWKLLQAAKDKAIQDAVVDPNYGLFADPEGKRIRRAVKNINRFYEPYEKSTAAWETKQNFADLGRAGNAGGVATDAYSLFQPEPYGYITPSFDIAQMDVTNANPEALSAMAQKISPVTERDIRLRDTAAPQMADLSGTISNSGAITPTFSYPKADLTNVDDVVVPPPLMDRIKNSIRGLSPNVKLGLGIGAGTLGTLGIYALVRKVQEDKRREEEERAVRAMQLRQMQMTDNSESY